MREEELEISLKVVIVGNGAVGKSSMIQRFCKGVFTSDYKKTIGVDFLERQIEVGGEEVRLMLWDTAGQEEFDAITKAYYRGAQACVLAFSTVDRRSFEALQRWKKKVEDECGEIPLVLVQNKIDLVDQALVDPEEVEGAAQELQARLYRTSVKEDLNVSQVFTYLAEQYLGALNSMEDEADSSVQKTVGMNTLALPHSSQNGRASSRPDSGTITLQPARKRTLGKRSLFKNACRIL